MAQRSASMLERDAAWAVLTVAIACVALTIAVVRFPINHDIGALLDMTQRVLAGERLYVEIWEPNPPLALWLLVPPVLVARVSHLPIVTVTPVWFTLLAIASLAVVDRVLAATELFGTVGSRRALVIALAFLWLGLAPYEVGQRDPLVGQLTTPYLFAAIAQVEGRAPKRWTAIVVGAFAAIGFALKPTYLPMLVLLEAYLYVAAMRHEAWRRAELAVIGAGVTAYGAFVVLATHYLASMSVGAELYAAYESTFWQVLDGGTPVLWLAAFAALAFMSRVVGRHVSAMLAIALVSFVASALLQAKGWTYHWLPAQVLALFVFALALVSIAERARRRGRFAVEAIAIAVLALFAWRGREAWTSRRDPSNEAVRKLTAFVRAKGGSGPVAWFSMSCAPAFPVLTYAGLHSMMPGTWILLPGIYAAEPKLASPFPYHSADAMTPAERHVLDSTFHAFQTHPPTLIVFERHRDQQGFGPTTFDPFEYLLRDPRFAAMFQRYRPVLNARDLLILAPAPTPATTPAPGRDG